MNKLSLYICTALALTQIGCARHKAASTPKVTEAEVSKALAARLFRPLCDKMAIDYMKASVELHARYGIQMDPQIQTEGNHLAQQICAEDPSLGIATMTMGFRMMEDFKRDFPAGTMPTKEEVARFMDAEVNKLTSPARVIEVPKP